MKKLTIWISLIAILAVVSISNLICNEVKIQVYRLEYVVFYPDYRDTQVVYNNSGFYWGSDRGSNYIKKNSITGSSYYNGSAPYKILHYTVVKEDKKKIDESNK